MVMRNPGPSPSGAPLAAQRVAAVPGRVVVPRPSSMASSVPMPVMGAQSASPVLAIAAAANQAASAAAAATPVQPWPTPPAAQVNMIGLGGSTAPVSAHGLRNGCSQLDSAHERDVGCAGK